MRIVDEVSQYSFVELRKQQCFVVSGSLHTASQEVEQAIFDSFSHVVEAFGRTIPVILSLLPLR